MLTNKTMVRFGSKAGKNIPAYVTFCRRFVQLDTLPLDEVPVAWRLTSPQQVSTLRRTLRMIVVQATVKLGKEYPPSQPHNKRWPSELVALMHELRIDDDDFLNHQIDLVYKHRPDPNTSSSCARSDEEGQLEILAADSDWIF
eukprot:TRINITY_DN1366_c0_g1_i24.p1 TRINITY_DN1366_c0_g1~~TRINITY_DN1366_c0_g1_i24.p1  ORF type:complete len:143 (-),score=17.62 TRINITY_DN1366_c0_g1_i24:105-533(-)